MIFKRDIPQVLLIVKIKKNRIPLNKLFHNYLNSNGNVIFIDFGAEVLLYSKKINNSRKYEIGGNQIVVDKILIDSLKLTTNSYICFIQRENAIALKKYEIIEKEGEWFKAYDHETNTLLTRTIIMNPEPEEIIRTIQKKAKKYSLKYKFESYLDKVNDIFSLLARDKLKLINKANDSILRKKIINDILHSQKENGSWDDDIILTARNLKKLADLNYDKNFYKVKKSIKWTMNRRESSFNPGMFFLSDELVELQEKIQQDKKNGIKKRFRQRLRSEINRILPGDDLLKDASGPRIMWPNGLVLEALFALGYTDSRIQRATETMLHGQWCECSYHDGISRWGEKKTCTYNKINEQLNNSVVNFRYRGVSKLDEFSRFHLSKKSGQNAIRTKKHKSKHSQIYDLEFGYTIQSCAYITSRAVSYADNKELKKIAEIELWRYASNQIYPDGSFPKSGRMHCDEISLLLLFSKYNTIISKVCILRALPWIINNQNEDGSWGKGSNKSASTYAVISALFTVKDLIPGLLSMKLP